MYGATDPMHMLMLIKLLGPDYVVWDKAATIRFKRPGRSTLYARFTMDDQEIEAIKAELARQASVDRVYTAELADAQGVVHADIEKTVYIRRKDNGQSNP
jgi:hypothetical protein